MKEGIRRLQPVTPGVENRLKTERNIRWVSGLIRLVLMPKVRFTVEGSFPKEGPMLALANHTHFLDPILMVLAAKRPIHFMATESLWHQRYTAFFCDLAGAIPRKKFVSDLQSVRSLKAWKAAGGAVGLFPEGERSWDGRKLPFLPGIERLVRMVDAPVVCCRILNGARHGPRWATYMRRGKMHIQFDPPYEFAKGTPPEEILRYLESRLEVDPDALDWPISGNNLASGLNNLLFACPSCFQFDALVEQGNTIACRVCGAGWEVNTRNQLNPQKGGEPLPLTTAVDRLKERLSQTPAADPARLAEAGIALESEPMVLLRLDEEVVQKEAEGRLYLTHEGLSVRQGDEIRWRLPLEQLTAVAVDMRRRLQFRSKDSRSYEAVLPTESVVKWYWIVDAWRKRASGGKA
jgi:1-acyl-sn-glycerol-3-phosphate acyltransferase